MPNPKSSEMLLPESKPHLSLGRLLRRPLDIPRRRIRPAEINPHVRLQTALQPANIRTVHDAIPHGSKQLREIRSAEIRSARELCEGILGDADAVEVNIGRGVDV